MNPDERDELYGNAWFLTNEVLRQIPANIQKRAQDAGMFSILHMIIMKAIRAFFSPRKVDHYEDIAGYAELAIRHLANVPQPSNEAFRRAKEIMNNGISSK